MSVSGRISSYVPPRLPLATFGCFEALLVYGTLSTVVWRHLSRKPSSTSKEWHFDVWLKSWLGNARPGTDGHLLVLPFRWLQLFIGRERTKSLLTLSRAALATVFSLTEKIAVVKVQPWCLFQHSPPQVSSLSLATLICVRVYEWKIGTGNEYGDMHSLNFSLCESRKTFEWQRTFFWRLSMDRFYTGKVIVPS